MRRLSSLLLATAVLLLAVHSRSGAAQPTVTDVRFAADCSALSVAFDASTVSASERSPWLGVFDNVADAADPYNATLRRGYACARVNCDNSASAEPAASPLLVALASGGASLDIAWCWYDRAPPFTGASNARLLECTPQRCVSVNEPTPLPSPEPTAEPTAEPTPTDQLVCSVNADGTTYTCRPAAPPEPTPEPVKSCTNRPDEFDCDCVDTGDNALMMFATTLVMLQTPGMGIAQAGSIKRKNALSMMMQTMTGMIVGSLLWFLFGYSLTFGPSQAGMMGNLVHGALRDIPLHGCVAGQSISAMVFVAFQMMFALMVPVIVTGSWAEKMTYPAFLVFIVLWPICVYYPLAHWVWNGAGWLYEWGTKDFAGGVTIHTPSGVAGFVVAVMLKRRQRNEHLGHHNLPMMVIGATLIWAGWYSFNGGSAFAATSQATIALLNTHLAACTSGMMWVVIARVQDGHWHLTEIMGGALAGLAGVTPGSGFVDPWAAVVIGVIVGVVSRFSVWLIKERFLIDDVLDVVSLQGAPGIVGSLLVGFFANKKVYDPDGWHDNDDYQDGLFFGGDAELLLIQTVSVIVAAFWSGFWTALIMLVMKYTIGIDVDHKVEETGLDVAQIGEQAYDDRLDIALDLGREQAQTLLAEAAASGDWREVESLIKQGADPKSSDYDGRTSLHLACAEGRFNVVKFLVEIAQCPINVTDNFGGTPLTDAVAGGHLKVIEYLRSKDAVLPDPAGALAEFTEHCSAGLNAKVMSAYLAAGLDVNAGDYDQRTPLMVAASAGNSEAVQFLLANGADPSRRDRWGKTPLDDAQAFGHMSIAAILSQQTGTGVQHHLLRKLATGDEEGSKLKPEAIGRLIGAAQSGDLKSVKLFISRRADASAADYDGRTALHLAAAGGHFDVVKFLVRHHAPINAMDRWRQTPLAEAQKNGNEEIVAYLKKRGATTTSPSNGPKLCRLAATNAHDALKALHASGVDMSASDYDGRTALHLAASEGHEALVRWLVEEAAVCPLTPDRFGGSPVADARRHGHSKIEKYLQSKADTLSYSMSQSMGGDGESFSVVNPAAASASSASIAMTGTKSSKKAAKKNASEEKLIEMDELANDDDS